jgi:hypothetical protein
VTFDEGWMRLGNLNRNVLLLETISTVRLTVFAFDILAKHPLFNFARTRVAHSSTFYMVCQT